MYRAIDAAFIALWQKQTSDHLAFNQSHGRSAAQSRSAGSLEVDVVTLALGVDIDVLVMRGTADVHVPRPLLIPISTTRRKDRRSSATVAAEFAEAFSR